MKDHEIRETVSRVTELCFQFRDSQQLRERIANFLVPVLKAAAPVAPAAVAPRDTRFTHPGCECCACPPAVCQAEAAPQQVAENAQEVARGERFEVAASLIANSLLGQATKEDVQEVEAILRERFPVVTAQPDERAAFEAWFARDVHQAHREAVLSRVRSGETYLEGTNSRTAWEAWQARAASQATVKGATCNDHGMIGGPSYYAPDEGGLPCPDCAAAPQVGTLSDEPPFFWRTVLGILRRQGIEWSDAGWVFGTDDYLYRFAVALLAAAPGGTHNANS